jgi:hypothetical protein
MASRQRARRHDDTILSQYEMPAFRAGVVKGLVQQIMALASTEQVQACPLIWQAARAALGEIDEWQEAAGRMLDYPYRRGA